MWGVAIPAALVGGLSLLAAHQVKRRKNALTEQRKETFERALSEKTTSETLYRLAEDFQRAGLSEQATLLRKRAILVDLSPEEKERNREILRKALCSKNLDAIERVATAFEEKGALGAAAAIRKYSAGISALRAEPKECSVDISDNHGHSLTLIPEDLLQKRDHSIKGEADHTHTVRLGPKVLERGEAVVLSSETNGHTHKVAVLCRPVQAATSKPADSA